jgi:hypothetical protein
MMTDIFRDLGKASALKLREEAASLTGTQIIDREYSIPAFDGKKDYSEWPVGSPATDEGQVWLLIQPHNAGNYAGRPSTLRALWGLAHTTSPEKAKPWVSPHGTSGLYMKDECYKDAGGNVWRCLQNDTVYPAEAWASGWEMI